MPPGWKTSPWTRLQGIELPKDQKPMADMAKMAVLNPQATREYMGDGNMGGVYQRSDEEMQAIWDGCDCRNTGFIRRRLGIR